MFILMGNKINRILLSVFLFIWVLDSGIFVIHAMEIALRAVMESDRISLQGKVLSARNPISLC